VYFGSWAIAVQADVTQAADVQRLVDTTLKTFGRLDILVNNAGTTGPQYNKPLVDMPEELWDFMLGNHLKSAFLCIKYAAPHMVKQGWGRIINTSSIRGFRSPGEHCGNGDPGGRKLSSPFCSRITTRPPRQVGKISLDKQKQPPILPALLPVFYTSG
jgi:NAD(P)-dependent dehydrogenase (short-subunit alcohol dehydrogenase family)